MAVSITRRRTLSATTGSWRETMFMAWPISLGYFKPAMVSATFSGVASPCFVILASTESATSRMAWLLAL